MSGRLFSLDVMRIWQAFWTLRNRVETSSPNQKVLRWKFSPRIRSRNHHFTVPVICKAEKRHSAKNKPFLILRSYEACIQGFTASYHCRQTVELNTSEASNGSRDFECLYFNKSKIGQADGVLPAVVFHSLYWLANEMWRVNSDREFILTFETGGE